MVPRRRVNRIGHLEKDVIEDAVVVLAAGPKAGNLNEKDLVV